MIYLSDRTARRESPFTVWEPNAEGNEVWNGAATPVTVLQAQARAEASRILSDVEAEAEAYAPLAPSGHGSYARQALSESLDTMLDAPNTETWFAFLQRNPACNVSAPASTRLYETARLVLAAQNGGR